MFTCKLFPGRAFEKVSELDKARKERDYARKHLEKLRKKMGPAKVVVVEKVDGKAKAETSESS